MTGRVVGEGRSTDMIVKLRAELAVAREAISQLHRTVGYLEAKLNRKALATNESALTTIVRVLSDTYTDAGVLIWLNAKNKHLPSKPDGNRTCSPAEYIAAGHADEVLAAARRIEGTE